MTKLPSVDVHARCFPDGYLYGTFSRSAGSLRYLIGLVGAKLVTRSGSSVGNAAGLLRLG